MTRTGRTYTLEQTFAGLDKSALDTLRHLAEERAYPTGVTLCHQGEMEHTFYIVVDGRVAVVRDMEDGTEQLLASRGPNEFFGEMALIDNTTRFANCVTVMPTRVLEVTEDTFGKVVEKSPAVAYAVMRRILASARDNDRRAIEELKAKHEALEQAYVALKAAQAELVVKERLERELELAADVQRSLLPGDLPQYPDYAFAAHLVPARQVGGDFYDVIALDDEHVGVLIADVADKGFHAALLMAVTRTLFLESSRHSLSPATVALAVHWGLLAVAPEADMFVTAFYGVLHRPSGQLRYVRAGHDRPLLVRPGREAEELTGRGRFLGMIETLSLEEQVIQLHPNDRLILYSDGVSDAVRSDGRRFGLGRLATTVVAAGALPAADLVAHIVAAVSDWCQGAPPFDDLTLLVVEAKSPLPVLEG
ncbi:MAG: PP2C family protein-serine/threonine phosphatase [Anaerolineae bacterium]